MRLGWATVVCASAGAGLLFMGTARSAAAAESRAREVPADSTALEVSPGSLDASGPGQDGPAPGEDSTYAPESSVFEQLQAGGEFDPELARRVLDESGSLLDGVYLPDAADPALLEELSLRYALLAELDRRIAQEDALKISSVARGEREPDSAGTSLGELAAAGRELSSSDLARLAQQSPGPGGYRYWRDEIGGMMARIDSYLVEVGWDNKKRSGKYDPLMNELHKSVFPIEDRKDFISRYIDGGNQARGLFEDECGDKEYKRREWDFSGEITFNSGEGSFNKEEQQAFSLEQRLKMPSGKEFSFYQRYDLDHSYVDSSTLSIGGEQKLPDLLWNGKLRLKEEFRLYTDRNASFNNRQDGLFQLDFDPNWAGGRWKADIAYKYNIKEYETFSPRSYRQNRAKLKLEHQFSKDLSASVHASNDDYTYSFGSNRGNTKRELGGEAQWQVNDQLSLSTSVEHEEKEYEVRKSRGYEQDRWEAGLRWQPDQQSSIDLNTSLTDYDSPFSPDRNYEDQSLRLRAQRSFSPRWQGDLSLSRRSKVFDVDPFNDVDSDSFGAGLSYRPDKDWSFYVNLAADSFDYANPDRAYDNERLSLGASYRHDDFSAGADWSINSSSYSSDPNRNYDNTSLGLNAGYQWGRHDLSAYYNRGQLDQADPASTSEYTDSAFGGRWQFKLSREFDLSLSYDRSNREYTAADSLKDTRFEARLEFEL
ncbi:porin [bacterium]|nr:porin [bacterium]